MQEAAFARVPKDELYARTGIQFLPFNTVYQLLSLALRDAPQLAIAEKLLLMGDLLAYLLCGRAACEYTNASTTQLLDPVKRDWDEELITRLGLPRHLLQPLVPPGTVLGPILPEIAALTGIDPATPVIAPPTHDTAAAVAAVPVGAGSAPWAYLSSGTWSLLGAELPAPCISPESRALDFTNEGGVDGTIRFLKNIFGLWLVQECRRVWERAGEQVDYAGLTREAEASPPFVSLINLDDPRLFAPDDMPALIAQLCRERGEPVPASRGALVRCALESLALKYRQTLRALDTLLGRKTERLHIIGGGVQNRLLCQMTADACGIPVVAGPVEATALGNIGIQAMATGALPGVQAMRDVISNSVELTHYTPTNTELWDRVAARGA
jgi:rhamnulokinase